MNAYTLQCGNCGSRLTVSDAAPKVITCPRCLYRLANPYAHDITAAAGGADGPASVGQATASAPSGPLGGSALPPPPLPMRVLPLESQASNDSGMINVIIVVTIVLLAFGAFVSANLLGTGSGMFNFIIVVLLGVFAGVIILASAKLRRRPAQLTPQPMATQPFERGGVLPYRSAAGRPPTNGIAVTGGFFGAIAVCAGCFFLLAGTVRLSSSTSSGGSPLGGLYLLVVIAAVVAFIFAATSLTRRNRWRGFGLGATIGLCLGMLALGPCAFCYLLTLAG